MKLGSSFVVPAERSRVFAHFLDPDSMRACIPGCAELERTDEEHYRGRLVNEIAHVRFSAGFSAEITGLREPEEVRAVLKGEDKRLGSSIWIDAILTVRPDGAASAVSYSLDLALRGKIGRLGESIVRRRSAEVERQFVDAFTRICAGDEAVPGAFAEPTRQAAPASGGRATATSAPPRARTGPAKRASWWRRLIAFVRPGSRRS
jgi:carbon monoxide dehydrogenase subunit G